MSHPRVATLTPPQIPTYLSDTHILKPIIGKPTDEEVQAIHAVIRALNSVSHIPSLYNPVLSMQLSQHLFDAQMAVYHSKYPMNAPRLSLHREKSIYTPPALPPDIPGALNQVVGAPSDEDIQSVQSVLRYVENLSNNPRLYDAHLSMKLSQHMFDLQFVRHMKFSAPGTSGFSGGESKHVSETPEPDIPPRALELTRVEGILKDIKDTMNGSKEVLERIDRTLSPGQETHSLGGGTSSTSQNIGVFPFFTRMEQVLGQMQETMKGSKDVLDNMNRVLISIQRSQSTVGSFDHNIKSTVHMNPVNQQGMLASECGLPLLRYWLSGMDYVLWMDPPAIAGYLKFFGIGAHLIQGSDTPTLIEGGDNAAAKLLFKHIGIKYGAAGYHHAGK